MHEKNLEKMRSVARPELRNDRKKISMWQERDGFGKSSALKPDADRVECAPMVRGVA
jgi:hypothetical protein